MCNSSIDSAILQDSNGAFSFPIWPLVAELLSWCFAFSWKCLSLGPLVKSYQSYPYELYTSEQLIFSAFEWVITRRNRLRYCIAEGVESGSTKIGFTKIAQSRQHAFSNFGSCDTFYFGQTLVVYADMLGWFLGEIKKGGLGVVWRLWLFKVKIVNLKNGFFCVCAPERVSKSEPMVMFYTSFCRAIQPDSKEYRTFSFRKGSG